MPTYLSKLDEDDPLDWHLFGQLWGYIWGVSLGGIGGCVLSGFLPGPRFVIQGPFSLIGAIIVVVFGVVSLAISRRKRND